VKERERRKKVAKYRGKKKSQKKKRARATYSLAVYPA